MPKSRSGNFESLSRDLALNVCSAAAAKHANSAVGVRFPPTQQLQQQDDYGRSGLIGGTGRQDNKQDARSRGNYSKKVFAHNTVKQEIRGKGMGKRWNLFYLTLMVLRKKG